MEAIKRRRRYSKDIVAGLVFIAAGAVLLFHQFGLFEWEDLGVRSVWNLWPLVFVIGGIVRLSEAPTMYHLGSGFWWITMGLWLYVSINHIYGLTFGETWPVVVILWGAQVVWKSLTGHTRHHIAEAQHGQ